MYRTLIILRHTFREAIVQPIYSLLLGLGVAILAVFGMLPYFTFGEDTIMFMDVTLDVALLLVLISTLFATSRSIYEEIEDRTMLTLMSKPVHRLEVLVGKYLGIISAALVQVAIFGLVIGLIVWIRVPGDYQMSTTTLDETEAARLFSTRMMHVMGVVPSMVLLWLQVSVLAAIGVAISTRLSLVANLPIVIIIYVAGNLTRFLFPLQGAGPLEDRAWPVRVVANIIGTVIPYLQTFDLRQMTVFSQIAVPGTTMATDPSAASLGGIWLYVGSAIVYAACYSTFALAAGLWLFKNRELGGAEG